MLLIQSHLPALRVLDARSGKPSEISPRVPTDGVAFVAAPQTPRAVTLTARGELALWGTGEQRQIALLDENVGLERVAFSPDGSQVAVATTYGKKGERTHSRIRIWDADTGKLAHELRPFEQSYCEAVEGLIWSNDGRYVLGATKSHSFFSSRGIDVWNAVSGRHRGEFTGPMTSVNGLALLPDGRLVAGCDNGIVRVWDATAAFAKIASLEAALEVDR